VRPLDIAIPFYRNAALAEGLSRSLESVRGELAGTGGSVIAINDSPDDAALARVLASLPERLGPAVPVELLVNESNLGFVRSANAGLRHALEHRRDVLLLNSDTEVFPGAITAMRGIAALDPMIGFVNPRSNHATLCSLPHQPEYEALPPAEAHAAYQRLAVYLPDFQYLPTAVGFCMLIRLEVLEEFGALDESYGHGYNEENDLVMRANRGGYRAVLANRAYVYHLGEGSFARSKRALEERNAEFLGQRYPEYLLGIVRYGESAARHAELMLPALLPGRQGTLDLVFDFSSFGPYHTGTFEAGIQVLKRAARAWRDSYRVHVIASAEARRFHGLDRMAGVSCLLPDTNRTFAVGFRFAQPFYQEHMARLSRLAVVNVYAMLDPIALDCLYLDQQGLQILWADVFRYADGVIYISDFVRDQFHLRFRRRPGLREMVEYLSLDLRDYAPPGAAAPPGNSILVIGNSFAHKHVEPTVAALREAFPERKILALGVEQTSVPGVEAYPSGHLPENQVNRLFRDAAFVVYPSLYEGFGFPLLEALSHSRPVWARDLPATRAIRDRLGAEDHLLLYTSTRELIERLRGGFPVWRENGRLRRTCAENNWDAIVCRLGDFLSGLLRNISLDDVLIPRLDHFHRLQLLDTTAQAGQPQFSAALGELAALRRMLLDREHQIDDLHNSLSWKISAPLRAIYDLLLRFKPK
jgi:GT2 family glycosyltransferase/glycosyltransferase involved in cell wall biosynthesis